MGTPLRLINGLAFEFGAELTIASGAITVAKAAHTVDTQSDASSDDLDTINGYKEGRFVVLTLAAAARNVVLKHGTGNIVCPGGADITLDDASDAALLWYNDGTDEWVVLASFLTSAGGGGLGALLASTGNGKGASLIGIEDSGGIITATDVEAALAENRTAIDLNTTHASGDGSDHSDVAANTTTRVRFLAKQVTTSDLTDAATSQTVPFGSALPAGAEVIGAFAAIATLFSGGSVSDLDVDIGINGGDTDAWADGIPAFTGDPTGRQYGPRGVWASGAGNTPAVTVNATGDNVDQLSAGDLTAYVFYVVIDA